jgi:hypothetical protein
MMTSTLSVTTVTIVVTKSSRTTRSLGCLLLLLKSESYRTPREKGRLLLLLKTKNSMTPREKGHLLLPPKTFHLHPSTEQLELLPNTDRETQPLPSTQQPIYATVRNSLSSDFFVLREKV